jgi:hypothetical protein
VTIRQKEAARAGKDVGKPGKNVSKISNKAAKKYGSKAAGKRVAGAILAKQRAKENEGAFPQWFRYREC